MPQRNQEQQRQGHQESQRRNGQKRDARGKEASQYGGTSPQGRRAQREQRGADLHAGERRQQAAIAETHQPSPSYAKPQVSPMAARQALAEQRAGQPERETRLARSAARP